MSAEYDREAARAAILYVAQRVEEPTFHKISKIFYFADRYHLEHFGSLMFGDTYKALDFGPLPTQTHRMMSEVETNILPADREGFFVTQEMVTGSPKCAPVVHPLREPDMSQLSQSVLESLAPAIELCKD